MNHKKSSTHHTLFKRSKQAFTLIEVMVALTLVSILLTIGFGAYSQMSVLEREGDQFRHAALQQRLAQTRLASLFLRIPIPDDFSKKKAPKAPLPSRVFYTSNRGEPGLFRPGSLVFTYDNQTDLWPEFCNDVIARLYVKEPSGQPGETGGSLWLATWPRPACSMDPSLARHEQLLEGVKEVRFRFFVPPEVSHTEAKGVVSTAPIIAPGVAAAPKPTPDSWNDTWLISYNQLPLILHLQLYMEERNDVAVEPNNVAVKPLNFYFPLITKRPPVLVDKQ